MVNSKNGKHILIEVKVISNKKGRGPTSFINSIKEILPYNTGHCKFIASQEISPINTKNKTDYFYISYPRFGQDIYDEWIKINKTDKLILGPVFVPRKWLDFPNKKIWKERRFPEILKSVKSIVVHSDRVKNYLAQKSNTTSMIQKYQNVRACTNLKPENIKRFNDRTIDIIFFEKYYDLDRSKQGNELFDLLKSSKKKVVRMKYGNYNKTQMIELAQNSKFIIYFSFFDTGAIGLKEIQNFGVITFTHQKEFILDKSAGFYIPELTNEFNLKPAYDIIMEKIEMTKKRKINTELIAKISQEQNKCEKALEDICKGL